MTVHNISLLDKAPTVRLVDSIINNAILRNASDIHIEPFESSIVVRIRVDGVLYSIKKLPNSVYNSLSTRIKIMALMDISIKRNPQDGKIKYNFAEEQYDLRVSTMPTIFGEKFVIRILYKNGKYIALENLGLIDIKKLNRVLRKNNGIIIACGPTGCGKSTTLYSLINYLNNNEKILCPLKTQ